MYFPKLKKSLYAIYCLLIISLVPSTVMALENAINQHIPSGSSACKVQHAIAYITWTNPNLNTSANNPGGGTFNRVAITEPTTANPPLFAAKYVEIGWSKQINLPGGYPSGDFVAVSYTDPNGIPQGYFVSRPQRNFHSFGIQYDPLIHHKWFVYENGQPVLGPNLSNSSGFVSNFLNGCAAVAGGEVVYGHENLGNTRFYNLVWGTISGAGIVSPAYWTSNTTRLHQGGYSCTVASVTDHTCGP